ncbi:uncharacterized protein LOC100877542 [Megachile rotundata]|uniref:uncharacterized protein LOC100877542 n=1 Tax=Megachile rotundata TaxID=143995 RepID=UPI003FD5EE6C
MEKKVLIASLIFFIISLASSERSLNTSDLKCRGRVYYNVTMAAYYPVFDSDNESDYLDARAKKLRTLQDFLDGRNEFVTVSMDLDSGIPYGTKVCIPELNAKFQRRIPLEVRDRSHYGDVKSKLPDFSHVDICVRTEEDTYDHSVNGVVSLYV